jgi:hypothetical protein
MFVILLLSSHSSTALSWFDKTRLAIAKVAGYDKYFNAAGADIAKLKLGAAEGHNHFVNTPEELQSQLSRSFHKLISTAMLIRHVIFTGQSLLRQRVYRIQNY